MNNNKNKQSICYCRVSSKKQKTYLERQQKIMKIKYPNYMIISDIGSGLNMKRKGLKKVVAYKWRNKRNSNNM